MGEDGQGRRPPQGGRDRREGPGIAELEGVLFDVGNTLLYLDYARLLETLATVVPPGTTVAAAARAERRARVRYSAWLDENRASTEDPRSFRRWVELALAELGAPCGDLEAAFSALCAAHRSRNFFSVPAPGALEAVRALAGRYKLAVVSNAGGRVAAKLEAVGFREFLTVVDSGLEGVEKPDPRIFTLGCERAGIAPERALYVGDLHAVDVAGARAAGIRAALLDPEGAWRESGVRDAELVADVAALAERLS